MNRYFLILLQAGEKLSLGGRKILFSDRDLFFMLSGIMADTKKGSWEMYKVQPVEEKYDPLLHILSEDWIGIKPEVLTIEEIVKRYLKDNGYDGLAYPEEECGCSIDDLCCCGGSMADCKPAYKISCNKCSTNPNNGGEGCEAGSPDYKDNTCFSTEKTK